MKRLTLISLCAAAALTACNDAPLPSGPRLTPPGPSRIITGFSAIDEGAGPADSRPNADAAAASFDAAASALQALKFENFESAPGGEFQTLALPEMTVTMSGTAIGEGGGISRSSGDAITGYNTTPGGIQYVGFVPPFGGGVVTITFTPNVKLQAWGAYFTGVGTVPNTSVEIAFDDGTAQTFDVPGSANGGATFFGFTDPGKIIASVTVRETLTSTDFRDILGIDDIRYAPAAGNTQFVPAGDPGRVTVTENGQPVAGIDFPAGTFDEDVTVTVKFVTTTESARCHDYLLGQTGRCLQITALNTDGEKVTNRQPMTAGLCLPAGAGARELFKFEDPQDTPHALAQTMVPFLDCDGFQVGSAAPDGSLKGLATGLANRVGRWLSPSPLYAAHGGFGGQILAGDGLSFFTWASPLQISHAGLAVNVRSSGKDAYALTGTFNLQMKGFEPFSSESGFSAGDEDVTVAFGTNSYTIDAGSFRYAPRLRRWLYAARAVDGITAMSFDPATGNFIVAATVPTAGALPIDKPFSLQIGHRTQGLLLKCGTTGACVPQELRQ